MLGNFFADGDSGDAELIAAPVVALHEHSHGIAASFGVKHAGCATDPSFKFIADHACATANVAFFNGAGVGGVERVPGIFGVDVESVDVVEPAIPGFGNDGKRPEIAFHVRRVPFDFPGDDGVADDADAVRVRDHYGPVEEA